MATSAHLAEQIANKISVPSPHAFQRPFHHSGQCSVAVSARPKRCGSDPRLLPSTFIRVARASLPAPSPPARKRFFSSHKSIMMATPALQNLKKRFARPNRTASRRFDWIAPRKALKIDHNDEEHRARRHRGLGRSLRLPDRCFRFFAPRGRINSPCSLSQSCAIQRSAEHDSKKFSPWIAIDIAAANSQRKFEQLYLARTGARADARRKTSLRSDPTPRSALRTTGNDRVLIRDYLANQPQKATPSALVVDSAGNDLQQFAIVNLLSR